MLKILGWGSIECLKLLNKNNLFDALWSKIIYLENSNANSKNNNILP